MEFNFSELIASIARLERLVKGEATDADRAEMARIAGGDAIDTDAIMASLSEALRRGELS